MVAVADRLDPIDQIRQALSGIRAELAKHGGRAYQLKSMTWTAERSARFYLARREVDLAYREVFKRQSSTDHAAAGIRASDRSGHRQD